MKTRNVTKRILIPLAVTLMVFFAIVVVSVNWLEEKHITATVHEDFAATGWMWHLEMEEDANLMRSVIETMIYEDEAGRETILKKALRSKDDEALLAYSKNLFEELQRKYDISHFYYHTPERVNILRVHQPERNGDTIDRFTAIEAEKSKDFAQGIELGPLGTFTLRVVVPWFDGEELLGYIELGKETEEVIEEISEVNDIELLVLIDKKFLDREGWTSGMEMLGRSADWDMNSTHVIASTTMELQREDIVSLLGLDYALDEPDMKSQEKLSLSGSSYNASLSALKDAGGREVGKLVILSDMTEIVAAKRKVLTVFIAICLTISIAIFLIFYRILARTDRELLSARIKIIEDATAREAMQEKHILALEKEKSELEEAKESIRHNYEMGRVLSSIMELSFKDHSLTKILEDTLDVILSVPFLSIEEKGAIFLTEDGEETIKLEAKRGLSEHLERKCSRVPFGRCLCGMAASTGRIVFKERLDEDHETRYEGISPHGHFCVPIPYGGRVLGVINTYLPDGYRKKQEDERFLSMAAEMLSGIIMRKRAEEANRSMLSQISESETRLRAMTASAADAIIQIDGLGRVAFWNEAAVKTFGYTAEEIIGKELCDFIIPEEYRDKHRDGLKNFRKSGDGPAMNQLLELSAVRKDGAEFPIEMALSSIRLEGEWHAVGVLRDITERKKADEELRSAKERAEKAAKVKSEFLANMSHEIRTPMNGIIGMTDLVMDTRLTKEQHEYLTAVKNSADSLMRIINDILDFSKIEAKKLDIEKVCFNLRDAIGDTMNTLALRASGKGIELAYRIPSDLPEVVIGDPGRIRQIIVNLAGNAIKFTSEGEVVLYLKKEHESSNELCLRFSVTDTGIGIPPDKLNNIFDAFTQADSSTTREFGGTGLGLSISSKIVELMGGNIWVESEVGKGSTFHFTLRLGVEENPEAVSEVKEEQDVLEGMPVLVVDDNATNRSILEEILTNWRMKPFAVESGEMALKELRRAKENDEPYKMLLTDCNMPVMDGFQLCERIKEDPELAGGNIMMLTSSGQRGDSARCRELGISGYLTKPVKQSSLLDMIMTVLGTKITGGDEKSPLVTRHTLRERERSFNILVTEDNSVNQMLALKLLEKLGYKADIAANGEEALKALELHAYDLVLMDCQMPVMDGYEATSEIRNPVSRVQNHKIPIVAMTANVMKGDSEKCIEAGMDDYISKPVNPIVLKEVLDKWLLKAGDAEESVPVKSPEEVTVVGEVHFCKEELLERVLGDEELAGEIIEGFLEDMPLQISSLKAAQKEADAPLIQRKAHSIKGVSGNVGATTLQKIAAEVEEAGKASDLERSAELLLKMDEEFILLKKAIVETGLIDSNLN